MKSVCLIVLAAITLVSAACSSFAATSGPDLEKQIDVLMGQMTVEEKASLCQGDWGHLRSIDRLHVPIVQLTDGPRGPHDGTSFPVGVAFGSTWNPELIQLAGTVMGSETRAGGNGMLLGPGVNIQRDPLGGRFFEYYTEDPYLNACLTTAVIKGIQSQGVAACIKHFACNNREDNRNNYMSMVDTRTLNEIYLPAFKAAVRQADVWAVMTSANGVNGDFVSDSKTLLNDTLKNNWGFKGLVMTDWLQSRSTEKAAFAGLDVSMPGGDGCPFGRPLLEAIKAGRVPMSVIDDKARRVLRTYGRIGVLDHRRLQDGAERNTPRQHAIGRQVAAEGIVLLKNTSQMLPLDAEHVHSVLVVGANADQRFCVAGMGGSSWMQGQYEITPLAGIRAALGNARVTYLSTDDLGGFQPIPESVMASVHGKKGWQAKYEGHGQKVERVDPQLNFMWEMRSPDVKIPPDNFHATYEGRIVASVSGTYTLRAVVGGDGSMYAEEAGGAPTAMTVNGRMTANVQLQAGKPFFLHIDYSHHSGDASFNLTWQPPNPASQAWDKVEQAARAADSVVVVTGIDHNLDTEGRDRSDIDFPPVQQALIEHVTKANPKTVVVLINGSPLQLSGWLSKVPAVIEAWYPGMDGGNAIADVLFGRVNPSGHLPFSWPRQLADSPSQKLGTQDKDRVDYKEGLLVGYRYFDTKKVEPEFPFGFGLSYTTFAFENLTVAREPDGVHATVSVKNTGSRDGLCTVQFYVRPLTPSVFRPEHELKAFRKMPIKAGDSKQIEVTLGDEAFSFYDIATAAWKIDPGRYEIQAGSSSRDLPAIATVDVARDAARPVIQSK
jgi:beta-glucosidase